MFCGAAIDNSDQCKDLATLTDIVAHAREPFRIIDLMRDPTDDQSATHAGDDGHTPLHPEDLRNVILGRPMPPADFSNTGDFSADAKIDAEPAWSQTTVEPVDEAQPEWQGRGFEDPDPRTVESHQTDPFYSDFGAETDRGHPEAVANLGSPAGFGRRVIAYLIDNAVTILILSLLFPFILGRPYLDVEAITEEFETASQEALPTATPVLGNNGDPNQTTTLTGVADEPQSVFEVFAGLVLAFAVTTVYNGMLVGVFGTTIGKRLLGVYVLDENGNIPGIPLAFGRALATIVSTAIFYIGYLFILRNDNRALHDLMVGTYAVTLTSAEQPSHRDQSVG